MQIYNYSGVTGEYVGSGMARESPLEPGVFLLPANATTIAPPTPGAGQAAAFINEAWAQVPDNRGQTWFKADGTQVVITQINVVPDPSWTATPPAVLFATVVGNALAAIDGQAGQTRLKYITDTPGQADTYTQKGSEAAAYKAAGYPYAGIASYPWTQAEAVAINGASPTAAQCQAAADGILAQQAAWVAKGVAIEQARRAGKIAVGAATTAAAVQTAQAAALAALQAL